MKRELVWNNKSKTNAIIYQRHLATQKGGFFMKFRHLNPRFVAAPIDEDRVHGLVALNTVGSTPLVINGFSLNGIGALATALVDTNGAQVNANPLNLKPYDYVALVISSATETYTFKTGGSSGTTTNTVVVVYTDSSRADISTVTKT